MPGTRLLREYHCAISNVDRLAFVCNTGRVSLLDTHSLAVIGLTVGFETRALEKDWFQVAPEALCTWEKMRFEPCTSRRNISYLAIHSSATEVAEASKYYLQQLSSVYEVCQLGEHYIASSGDPNDESPGFITLSHVRAHRLARLH